ncbi:hypothetical protein [Achromobacter spanius]|uniref:hypothetical protein n=1 Tax=Achromobacter spanius TaxID=217203 RepID=UPI003F6945EA
MTILKTGQGIANGVYDAARGAVGVLRLAADPDAQQAAVNSIVNDGRALWEEPGTVARNEFDRAVKYLGKSDVSELWHDSVRGLAAGVVGATTGPAARIALADGLSLTSTGLRVVGDGIGDVADVLARKQGFSLGVLSNESKNLILGDLALNNVRVRNLTERGTLTNLHPQDLVVAQRPVRNLVQDGSGRYWLETSSGNRITPSGSYDFVTLPDGRIRVARPNTNIEFSTHLGLSGGREVSFAGAIRFGNSSGANRGSVVQWTNHSGHYQPPAHLKNNAGLPIHLFFDVE